MARLKFLSALTVILVLANSTVTSQTFQDFKKQIRDEYDTFEKETQGKFNNFVAETDKEFSTYLSDNFENYDIGHEKFTPSVPKPTSIPVTEEIVIPDNVIDYEVGDVVTTYQGPIFPGIKKSEVVDFEVKRINIDFLGWPLFFDLDKAFFDIKIDNTSANEISSYWTKMSNVNYNHFLFQILETANVLNINQWGYYQLIKTCSKQVFPGDVNMQVLFQWAMLTRSRYKTKIGFSDNNLFLLIPSVYQMYNMDFVSVDGTNYYIIDGKGKQIETYKKDFPEADILMDVSIQKPIYTNEIKKSKDFHFTYRGNKYTVNLAYDEEMIMFYSTIPLSDISVYFNSVVSSRTKTSVIEAFKPILKGKDDVESANILLSFMQQAFAYKTDQYAYGTEKYFFADELLHYPFSDCEDRSVLFAYLVKTLLNKDVIALGFPGHMATAINFKHEVDGIHLDYNNNTFVVADPTFYGAPVGLLVTSVIEKKATVIPLKNDDGKAKIAELVWKKTNAYGGLKADRLDDIVFDSDGNIYVCGYFVKDADFDGYKLTGNDKDRDVFIAKFDKSLNVLWAKSATGSGNDLAYSMALGDEGNLFVYGSVENDLNFSGTEITAVDVSDVFVANYTPDGKLNWVKKAGIDKLDHSLDFMFAAKFNPEGEKIMAKLYSQAEDFDHYGLEIDDEGNASIVGSFYATTGINSNKLINYNEISNIPDALHKTDSIFKTSEYEDAIAGLFATFKLLKSTNIEIQGTQIKSTFDKYNNKFETYASEIYHNLVNMSFVRNNRGIITIKISKQEPILLDKIKINNNARIKIVAFKSGNFLIEILSGIYVGAGNHWLDMNSIKLFKESGDLLFDFDSDNSVSKLNLKDEILKRNK